MDLKPLADGHFVNVNLTTELELPSSRDTLLHFFEQIKKLYPEMRNFFAREPNEYVLEQDKDAGHYRWTSIEPKRISSGYANPESADLAMEQHYAILDLMPYSLSVSPLDCESLNFMYGFDFTFRGNHHQLIAETLGVAPALERLMGLRGSRLVSADQALTVALDDSCRTQFRLQIEPRTTAYQIRAGEFPEDPLSVYLTVRRYGSLDPGMTYRSEIERLHRIGTEILQEYVIEQVLLPLQRAIAIQ
jgi:hypothetical protein